MWNESNISEYCAKEDCMFRKQSNTQSNSKDSRTIMQICSIIKNIDNIGEWCFFWCLFFFALLFVSLKISATFGYFFQCNRYQSKDASRNNYSKYIINHGKKSKITCGSSVLVSLHFSIWQVIIYRNILKLSTLLKKFFKHFLNAKIAWKLNNSLICQL